MSTSSSTPNLPRAFSLFLSSSNCFMYCFGSEPGVLAKKPPAAFSATGRQPHNLAISFHKDFSRGSGLGERGRAVLTRSSLASLSFKSSRSKGNISESANLRREVMINPHEDGGRRGMIQQH